MSLKSIIGIAVGIILIFFLVKLIVVAIPVILVFIGILWLVKKFNKKESKDSDNNIYEESYKVNSEDGDNNYIDVDYEDLDK